MRLMVLSGATLASVSLATTWSGGNWNRSSIRKASRSALVVDFLKVIVFLRRKSSDYRNVFVLFPTIPQFSTQENGTYQENRLARHQGYGRQEEPFQES